VTCAGPWQRRRNVGGSKGVRTSLLARLALAPRRLAIKAGQPGRPSRAPAARSLSGAIRGSRGLGRDSRQT
jgi:hypothetical protein